MGLACVLMILGAAEDVPHLAAHLAFEGAAPIAGATGPVELMRELEARQREDTARLQKSLLITGACMFAIGNAIGWGGYFLWLDDLRVKNRHAQHDTPLLPVRDLTPRGGSMMIAGAVIAVGGLAAALTAYLLDVVPPHGLTLNVSPHPTGGAASISGAF